MKRMTSVSVDLLIPDYSIKLRKVSGLQTYLSSIDVDISSLQAGAAAFDPTTNEKAALAGTSGAPSATNKYVTNADSRNSDARTPSSHASTHFVGAGDPMTPEDWIAPTLLNNWVNYGGTFSPAGYYKDPFGVVHLRGLLKDGVMGATAFILPLEYRPPYDLIFASIANDALSKVFVDDNGNVLTNIGSNVWWSIDGITFRAA